MNEPQKPSFAPWVNEAAVSRPDLNGKWRFSMFDRRAALAGGLALITVACAARGTHDGKKGDVGDAGDKSVGASAKARHVQALRDIEARSGGRLGAFVVDPAQGRSFGWRANERFAHCSSFKLSLAAMVLAKADAGEADLAEMLHWSAEDLLPTSPVTVKHVVGGLTVGELARAAQVTSDNTAANVLLQRFGGPQELTRFWRSLGDEVSRLDRLEPELNSVSPGSEFDTTTPAAMAATVAALVLGETLTPSSRATLKRWMKETETGLERVRAGFPEGWEAGDKTGTGMGETKQTYVDLAFGGPRGRTPLIVAAYYEPARPAKPMNPLALRALAQVGRIAAASLSG